MLKQRFLVMFLGFYASSLMFTYRASLSVAILSMVKTNTTKDRSSGSCIIKSNQTIDIHPEEGLYEWSETLQGLILSAPMYPNVIMPLVSGFLADRFGAKWLAAIAVAGPGLLSSLVPMAADCHVYVLICLLFLMGACSACVFSPLFSLFSNWFPADEMPYATGSLAFGNSFGLAVGFLVAGYLSQYRWQWVFYTITLVHIPWTIVWLWLATDAPKQSRWISQAELEYITQKRAARMEKSANRVNFPWSRILRSGPVWASVVAKFAENFGFYILLLKMPAYLDLVFGVSVRENGLINLMIHLSTAIGKLASGPLSAWLLNLNVISLTNTRKLFETFCLLGPAVSILLIPTVGCDLTTVFGLLLSAMLTYGFMSGGEWPITAEFAPELAGTVFGFCYVIGITSSFVAPIVAGIILNQDPSNKEQWNLIFYLTAGIYIVGATIFDLLTSAEPQPWAVSNDQKNDKGQQTKNYSEAYRRRTSTAPSLDIPPCRVNF